MLGSHFARGKIGDLREKDFLPSENPKFSMEESETWVELRTFTPPLPLAQTTPQTFNSLQTDEKRH